MRMRSEYAQNSLIILSNRHNFSAFIGSRGRSIRWYCRY